MSKKTNLIKSIQLVIGDKEIDLSIKEAKVLFGELKDLFGETETVVYRDRHVYKEYPWDRWTWVGGMGTYTVSDNVTLKCTMDEPVVLSTTTDRSALLSQM